jgi:hypothetical protein
MKKFIMVLICSTLLFSCATANHKINAGIMSGNQYGDDPTITGLMIGFDILAFLITSIDLAPENPGSSKQLWRCHEEPEDGFVAEDYNELQMYWVSKHPEKYDEQGYVREDYNEEADDAQSLPDNVND